MEVDEHNELAREIQTIKERNEDFIFKLKWGLLIIVAIELILIVIHLIEWNNKNGNNIN